MTAPQPAIPDRPGRAGNIDTELDLLRSVVDAMPDLEIVFGPVRDPDGKITDFTYLEVNRATCDHLGVRREDLIGQSLVQTFPNIAGIGLLDRYVRCAQTGEPVALDDVVLDNAMLGTSRRYDIRGARTQDGWVTVTYRDVTERYEAAGRQAESDALEHGLMENSVVPTALATMEGRLEMVNQAACDLVGYDAATLRQMDWQDLTPAEYLDADLNALQDLLAGRINTYRVTKQLLHADGHRVWVDSSGTLLRDAEGNPHRLLAQMIDITEEVEAREQLERVREWQAETDAIFRRSMDSASVGMCLVDPEGGFIEVNDALCEFFGYDAKTLMTKTWQELTTQDYLQADLDKVADVLAGRIESYRMVKQYIHADGHLIWGDLSVGCLRDSEGQVEVLISQVNDITEEVRTREQLEKANRRQAEAVALYRRSMDSAAVGMCLALPQGAFLQVNDALCEFFGYDAETLLTKSWMELTAPDYVQADLDKVADMVAGRIESYRMTKQFIHADGHLIWGDLSVGCLRNPDGSVAMSIGQIVDITDEVTMREQLVTLIEAVQADLDAAARYMVSIMPGDLDGTVPARSRYLPSRTLGGDAFDYRWLDDDHLMMKMHDVSGHGIEPALLSVSIHNLLRSGTLSSDVLMSPQRMLTELNRLFPMERHGEHYFTLWYGIYRPSTRTLTYAGAGHPPALLFTDGHVSELPSQASPVGMFTDADFTATTLPIPPGSRLLLYSDGAFELALPDGGRWSLPQFTTLCTELARSPEWSLDTLIDKLRVTSATGEFDDDCSLISLQFD